jgi:hypothetical protein
MTDIERRAAAELRATGNRLEGYAAVFDSPSVDLGGFVETIRRRAFASSLQRRADVLGLYHHDTRAVLARTTSGTLRLAEDSRGLHFQMDVANTTAGRDVLESVGRGDISGASIGFRTVKDKWQRGSTPAQRELLEVDLFDVTVTASPAYPETSVARRSLERLTGAAIFARRRRYLELIGGSHGHR